MKLKTFPTPFSGRSDTLTQTKVPVGSNPRAYYLANISKTLPPCTSSSEFVPRVLIEHLMRKKKDSALGVKFLSGMAPPDAITNMEGAMHTFVTPIVLALLHGDYVYNHGHGLTRFQASDGKQQARTLLISAQIQPDFEGQRIFLALSALEKDAVVGQALGSDFSVLNVPTKQISSQRKAYDDSLRRHMIAHLTQDRRLPSLEESKSKILDLSQTMGLLEKLILTDETKKGDIKDRFVRIQSGYVLSLELLYNTAIHQLRNEISALEVLSPQGYVYTFDPPAIFAREIGATILNRLQFAGLKQLALESVFSNMRVFAFNDYADRKALTLIQAALTRQKQVLVVPKAALFKGPGSTYSALPGSEGALLVIHNNSDAFGQNIETEWETGSMDGAIGANSSAAASLKRDRPDLVNNLM